MALGMGKESVVSDPYPGTSDPSAYVADELEDA